VGNEDLLGHFEQCFNFIEQATSNGGKVLVHCEWGVSRSATVMIAFLMKKLHINYSEARKLLQSKRPEIYPNEGFVEQLLKYENQLGKNE